MKMKTGSWGKWKAVENVDTQENVKESVRLIKLDSEKNKYLHKA